MPLNVEMRDCYQYTGKKSEFRPCDAELTPRVPSLAEAPTFGLRIAWPKAAGFLTVRGQVIAASENNVIAEFLQGSQGTAAVARQMGLELSARQEETPVISAAILKNSRLLLEFRVDTESPHFIKASENPEFRASEASQTFLDLRAAAARSGYSVDPASQMPVLFDPASSSLTIILPVTYYKKGDNAPLTEPDQIRLTLRDVMPPPPYAGYVAIDLGNTSSSLACIDRAVAGRGLAGRVNLLRLETDLEARPRLGTRGEPIRSSLRIDRIRVNDFATTGWHPKIALWVVDRLAEMPGIGEVIVGPKRQLASRDWETLRTLQVYNTIRESPQASIVSLRVPKRLPAELFLCRLLEKFREASNREPMRLAITYPTTYTRRELNQLSQVVQRAWLRFRYKEQDDKEVAVAIKKRMETIDQERVSERDEGICLLLDEATAAAFYFLYRKIFDRPGGLPRFRYVYPQGLNMLLYDCGGGTTDIALVRAVVKPDSPQFLTIRVLDRTGLRDFGGDEITIAAFRVLKARIALAVASRRGGFEVDLGNFPQKAKAASLDDYLRQHEDAIDEVVPTKFQPTHPNVESRRNQERAQAIWIWAEWLKAHLSRSGDGTAPAFDPPMDLRQHIGKLIDVGIHEEEVTRFIAEIGEQVERWMVDALIRGAVERSVRKCNKLIARPRPEEEAPPPSEPDVDDDPDAAALENTAPSQPPDEWKDGEDTLDVHWVVIAGNASRYPLIREMLQTQLDIAFRKTRFEPLDYENLKHAVAKGAALAFKAINQAQGIRVRFAHNLTNHLPYTLGFKDENWDEHSILFRENDHYAKMRPRVFEAVPKSTDGSSPKQHPAFVNVDRRWPGDDEFDGHLQFEFPGGVRAPVALQYNTDSQDFDLIEQAAVKRKGVPHEIAQEKIYVSPMQRGDL